jgi:hypothetical protein
MIGVPLPAVPISPLPYPFLRRAITETHTADPGHSIPFPMDVKLVEMGIDPPHSSLEDVVQIGDSIVTVDEQALPDHWADAHLNRFGLVDREGGA